MYQSTRLPSSLQRAVESSKECGASSWLTALPISEHGFDLHKGAFRDALCLRYGWQPPLLPAHCVCGKQFSVDHALSCPCGGFTSIRHNEIRNITAHLMSEVCHNVGIEPLLQPLSGESLKDRSANREDGARLDVMSQGFWAGDRQCAFFDVRVFNLFAHSNRNHSLTACCRRHEQEKRSYDQRVRDVEHGSFSPLVWTALSQTRGWHPPHNCTYLPYMFIFSIPPFFLVVVLTLYQPACSVYIYFCVLSCYVTITIGLHL